MKVRRFEASDTDAIGRLNQRLRAAGASQLVFGEGIEQKRPGSLRERLFVAEEEGEIRGTVWLKEQAFRVRGEDVVCGWLKYPVAESLIDPRFKSVPASLIMQCLREQPRLFALGLGGHETPLARMLQALKWTGTTVPMFVRVLRAGRTLRQLRPARSSPLRRAASGALAFTGVAAAGFAGAALVTRLRHGGRPAGYAGEQLPRLGPWADETWNRARDRYAFAASRDAATVEAVIPPTPDIMRVRVRKDGTDVGWATILRHDFSVGSPDPNFGTLTVGLIADGLALPEHAAGVIAAAFEVLAASGADLVLSNQLHPAWIDGLRRLGFVGAPSNFAFYASPRAAPLATPWPECQINRGDCDGPLWYDPIPWQR